MRCLGCQHDAGYSKPQLAWGGILLSPYPFWIRFCQLNFCLNFSNSFSINFQEKFLLTLLFGPSFFINFQDNFAPTLLFGTPVKYIWNSRHPGRSKVQKSRKSSGDNCQKILTNWFDVIMNFPADPAESSKNYFVQLCLKIQTRTFIIWKTLCQTLARSVLQKLFANQVWNTCASILRAHP